MADNHADNCPHCGVSLIGAPIETESQEWFGGATHFRREIGIEVRGAYDGVLYWQCRDCGKEWHRFAKGMHYLSKTAEKHMKRGH